MERLDQRAEQLIEAHGIPGLAVALTDREGLLAVRTYGFGDVAARSPVRPETLFEIGSIGKSVTAFALMQLVEEGRVDLDAPVTELLSWFEVRSAFAPITVHHLLNHTASIIEGSDISSDSRFDVWALRDTEATAPPGERFGYSNVGYKALGFALEEVEGRPYADLIRDRVFAPCGMTSSEPVITNAMRGRLATPYTPHPDDRPVRDDAVLSASWLETATGDGCQACTVEDLAAFLRMILNRGRGDAGRVVGEASFQRMTVGGAVLDDGGARYGYGLRTRTVDGRTFLGHGGDMVGFSSSMHCEPATGLGAAVLTNCMDYESWAFGLVQDLLGWAAAESAGSALPAPPPPPDPWRVEDAAAYEGEFRARDGDRLEVVAEGDRLFLVRGGDRVPLLRWGDAFLVDHPDFERFDLRVERGDEAAVTAVHHGSRRWHRVVPTTELEETAHLAPFVGHYRSHNPWMTNFRVVLREDALVFAHPAGWEEPLVELSDGRFRIGADERSPERLEFDAIVNGEALRAVRSGCPYYRAFTP
jgi:CubicO group peptidase (beta-lactamase class C family)